LLRSHDVYVGQEDCRLFYQRPQPRYRSEYGDANLRSLQQQLYYTPQDQPSYRLGPPKERAKINEALKAADLSYDTLVDVRHPLDILVNDIGLETIAAKATHSLKGIRVAPYYGCQIVRPHGLFDDVDDPIKMGQLLSRLGAEPVHYPCKVRCCGGMLMTTKEDVALALSMKLLEAAVDNNVDLIATACPLCQMNLEAYQKKINKTFGRNFHVPVVYFSHLVGAALGIDLKEMGLNQLFIRPEKLYNVVQEVRV